MANRGLASSVRINGVLVRRRVVAPALAPGLHHARRVLCLSQASVVAPQRAKVVALLDVEVVAQDHATIAQVRPEAAPEANEKSAVGIFLYFNLVFSGFRC